MTSAEKALVEANLDGCVEITLLSGERRLIRPVILVDEPPTPDLFYLPLDRESIAGESVLLSDIAAVRVVDVSGV